MMSNPNRTEETLVLAPPQLVMGLPSPPPGYCYAMPQSALPLFWSMLADSCSNPLGQQQSNLLGQQHCNPVGQQHCNPVGQQHCNPVGQQHCNPVGQQHCNPVGQQHCNPVGQTSEKDPTSINHNVGQRLQHMLWPRTDAPTSPQTSTIKGSRKGYCNDFQTNACLRGKRCLFLHEMDPARDRPCWQFTRDGSCNYPNCRYRHATTPLRETRVPDVSATAKAALERAVAKASTTLRAEDTDVPYSP